MRILKKTISAVLLLSIIILLSGCSRYPNTVFSPEDAEGKRIGGLAGTPSLRLADELGMAFSYYTEADMMSDLRGGIIDCVIMERTTALDLIAVTSGVRILSEPLVEYELSFAIPMENLALLQAVDMALDQLNRNGTLRGITNRYFARGSFVYESDRDMEREGYLRIALPSDSPPFSFTDESGTFIGMDVDIAMAVSDVLGVELRVIEYNEWELVTAVHHGRADLALGWHPGEGEGLINKSEPYASAVHVIIVRR